MTAGAKTVDRAERRSRSASDLSDKQIAQAAMRGRKVTFSFVATQPAHELVGYVVGMDSYHWMVATPVGETPGEDPIVLTLVHKSQPGMIRLHTAPTLDTEPDETRQALARVGQGFWSHCQSTYAGR